LVEEIHGGRNIVHGLRIQDGEEVDRIVEWVDAENPNGLPA
jgi:hypothetical protein